MSAGVPFGVPFPRRGDDGIDVGIGWAPAENLLNTCRIGDESRGVAGEPRFFRYRNFMAGNTGDRIDQVTHRTARAGTEIEDKRIILR